MYNTYAILICEDSLDLIEALNGSVRPGVEEDKTVFVYPTEPYCAQCIMSVDEFYERYPKVTSIGTDLIKI